MRAREGNEGEAEDVEEVEEAEDRMRVALSSMSSSSATLVISSGQLSKWTPEMVRLMNPGSEASQGDKDGRVLPTDRSDVQMCLSKIILWIAMYTGFHSPLPSRSW